MELEMTQKSPFLESVRRIMRLRGYNIVTEKSYLYWIRYYIRFHGYKHPASMDKNAVTAFLDHLASDRRVTSNTQRVALNALSFLYTKVLNQPLGELGFKLATKPRYIPTVLTPLEVKLIFENLQGVHRLIVELMYGSGLRVSECLRLRVHDLNFNQGSVVVHNGRGDKDRVSILSQRLKPMLMAQVEEALEIQKKDNSDRFGPSMPDVLGRKYPNAFRTPGWMLIFPSTTSCYHPISDTLCRHHLHASEIRKAIKRAATAAGINKPINCHTFRHSFASHLLESGTDIRTVQELLGHNDVRATQIYTHMLGQHYVGALSPLDMISGNRTQHMQLNVC